MAVGVLAWDYARSANKDEAKRRKEEEYRARVDKKFESFHNVGILAFELVTATTQNLGSTTRWSLNRSTV